MQGLGSGRQWNRKGAFTLSAGLVFSEAVICFDRGVILFLTLQTGIMHFVISTDFYIIDI